MKTKGASQTIRRSVALSRRLVEEVKTFAPLELKGNFNRLVTVALREFAAQRKEEAFEKAMARMAADPAIKAECTAISKAFFLTETDGLKND